MLAGAQQSNPRLPNVHFSGSQSPARSSKSQLDQTAILIIIPANQHKKMYWLNILHCEFAENELKVWYESLLRLSV